MISLRSAARSRCRSARRGVSLIELLVVLAILLLLFGVAGLLVRLPLMKARLAAAANNMASQARRVAVEQRSQRGGQGLFVFLKVTPGTGVVELVADTNPAPGGDGVYQDPAGGAPNDSLITTIQEVRLPDGIVFYNMGAASTDCSTLANCFPNWGQSGGNPVLGLDFQGRTVAPNGRPISGVASVWLTHADMASGDVTPLIVHRLTIGAVWSVRLTRLVKDSAAPTGWREF